MSNCFVCHKELIFDFERFVGVCLEHYHNIAERLRTK